jgi:metal-sulfur cluster biosynthetic enzyme
VTEADVRDALREVIDPEIGVNIVDLGLVYGVAIDGRDITITMTMTSPACPLRDYLESLVESAVSSRLPEVRKVSIDITFDPPWSDQMMSDTARRQLE